MYPVSWGYSQAAVGKAVEQLSISFQFFEFKADVS